MLLSSGPIRCTVPEAKALVKVKLLYSPAARQVLEAEVDLPASADVATALEWARQQGWAIPAEAPLTCGIWGRRVSLSEPLREGDRVEVYRPLRVDPKVARRERFKGQGARTAGLFSRRRPGAKPGY